MSRQESIKKEIQKHKKEIKRLKDDWVKAQREREVLSRDTEQKLKRIAEINEEIDKYRYQIESNKTLIRVYEKLHLIDPSLSQYP